MQLQASPRSGSKAVEPPPSFEDAFDAQCFDFTAYLGRRFLLGRDGAHVVLAEWLRDYEPLEFSEAAPATEDGTPAGTRGSGAMQGTYRQGAEGEQGHER